MVSTMDEIEIRKAAFAAARARAEVMLDPGACRDAINVEAAERAHRRLDESFEMPTPKAERQADNVSLRQPRMTDAVSARLMAEIDRRIAAAVGAAVSEIEQMSEARLKATGLALGEVRAKLRQQISDEVASLRADLYVERAHASDSAKVIDMPNPLKDRSRAG